jgi:hypothetical protein
MKLIRFTLTSLSPGMLLNPATPELLEALRTKKQAQKRTDWTVEQEAGTKLYRSEHGRMGIPTQNLMACIVNAGQHVKSGKKSLSTAKSTQIFDFLEFVDDFCEFLDLDDKGNVRAEKPSLTENTRAHQKSEKSKITGFRKKSTLERNDLIYKNRHLPRKEIMQMVSKKFGKTLDYGHISKIISLEKKRRENK